MKNKAGVSYYSFIFKAAQKILKKIDYVDKFVLVDYGCAEGRNSIETVKTVVDLIEQETGGELHNKVMIMNRLLAYLCNYLSTFVYLY